MWAVAATLSRVLGPACPVRIVETPNEEPSAIASVPSLHRLLRLLGIDEVALMGATSATFGVGVEHRDWSARGDRYFQGFGAVGAPLMSIPFHHHWLRAYAAGDVAPFEEFSPAAMMARVGRFAPQQRDPGSVLPPYSYAWHFESDALAREFRAAALRSGATALPGEVAGLRLAATGDIEALELIDGTRVEADLFLDCSGTRATLATLMGAAYEDWSDWLPCDRVSWVRCGGGKDLPPYSETTAIERGWRFRMPLQTGDARGEVWSSEHADEDTVCAELMALPDVREDSAGTARLLRGRPREFWIRNCVQLPGAALDPLEGTALHLAQSGVTRLLAHLPVTASGEPDRREYNRLTIDEYDRLRDLLALHYLATTRDDSPFWHRCRGMRPPDSLVARLALFTDSARLTIGEDEHCGLDGWLGVLFGQRVSARSYDPLAEGAPLDSLQRSLAVFAAGIREAVGKLPTQRDFLERRRAAIAGPA
jgi:tryptophan halogenase